MALASTTAANAAPVAIGRPKVWLGSSQVAKPGKWWNGSTWMEKPWKSWTGTVWKGGTPPVPEQIS